jgi:hypothetical protein
LREQQQQQKQLLLRYRFDTRAQAATHLYHHQSGRLLLFYPDPVLRPAVGTPAAVDLTFDDSDQSRVLTGDVVSVGQTGFYLRSAAIDLAREIREGLQERHHRRLGSNLFVEVQRGLLTKLFASMLDVSLGGAQLGGIMGLTPNERVRLRMVSSLGRVPDQLGMATVAWSRSGTVGLKFDRSDSQTRLAVGALNETLLEGWARAASLRHSPGCCKLGMPVDPPVPTRLAS